MKDPCVEPPAGDALVVGRIIRPHGIRGAVIVAVVSDWPELRYREGASLLMELTGGRREVVHIRSAAPHKGHMLVYLSGVECREAAEALKGSYLLVEACDAALLGEDEYWAHEMEGMVVRDAAGAKLGVVSEVILGAAQDLLVVRDPGGEEFRIPMVKEFVKEVDTTGREIVVEVIEGMVP